MKLHREVKKAYAFGNDGPAGSNGLSELMESRENVRKAIERLGLDAGVEAQESPDGAKQSEGNDPTDANAEGDDEDISAWA